MITFETQEDFEQVVIELMKNYLSISTNRKGDYYGGGYVEIKLYVGDELVSFDTISGGN